MNHYKHFYVVALFFYLSVSLCYALSRKNLHLVQEYKVSECVGLGRHSDNASVDYEASGVIKVQNQLYLVFDNMPTVAIVDEALQINCINASGTLLSLSAMLNQPVDHLGATNLLNLKSSVSASTVEIGFEAITVLNDTLIVVQEIDTESTALKARVKTYTMPAFESKLSDHLLDYLFDSENKGIEGVAVVNIGTKHFLFALCEGNYCAAGNASREPGHGTILVYYQNSTADAWIYNDKIHLPLNLLFTDFSGMDVQTSTESMGLTGDLAVVSQESHGLFVGTYVALADTNRPSGFAFHMPTDAASNALYLFPQKYCNIEGITFLDGNKIAVVSDKTKLHQNIECEEKDQSVHIFWLGEEMVSADVVESVAGDNLEASVMREVDVQHHVV